MPTLPHDQIVPLPVPSPGGAAQQLAARFQPYLTVVTGCAPHPAVDAAGNISEGLDVDSVADGCGSSPGQVYSRSRQLGDRIAIVYAWYFPKDCPAPGLGHRHDWEGAVCWLRTTPQGRLELESFAYSQHGRFYSVAPTAMNTVEERPLLAYSSYRGRITHSMWLNLPPIGDGHPGTLHPLVDWTELPDAAREALETADFGAGDVLCTDRNFRKNLMKSWHGGPQELMDLLLAAEPEPTRR